ncbi:hypothetical protein Lfu02_31060 [Longispora fulva]|uniref:Uncharacterized protein n=1 Tax=Longispora fulva TaxID=619741 RepID=A0A8J7GKC8_9ACTN|nr:hypothetical protein [Longispora fulva]MBG6139240.1 hypothetical protein [Longispora fulva]GIG58734.1 hypothetical protein Lfu02_31060 [Longispora fulva]
MSIVRKSFAVAAIVAALLVGGAAAVAAGQHSSVTAQQECGNQPQYPYTCKVV